MIERIIEAFTKGQAFRSWIDDVIILGVGLVGLFILGLLYFGTMFLIAHIQDRKGKIR